MINYSLEKIKEKILVWFKQDMSSLLINNCSAKITKNNRQALIIDYTFKHCLAQITVTKGDFTPYNLVAFEAIDKNSEKLELIYFYYDSIKTNENQVIIELQNAVQYSERYVTGQLRKNFINKKGYIVLNKDACKSSMHPDDVKNLEEHDFQKKFICLDTQFQYLVVSNNDITVRISPSIFKTV